MTTRFKSRWAADFAALLRFKRSRGYRYARGEFTLREFDRFLLRTQAYPRRAEGLAPAILAWLARKPHRKAIRVSADASVLRQFCRYLRRCPGRSAVREPRWPRPPTESTFVPSILAKEDLRLPGLSAYRGHDDILGTETYLTATPQLLGLAAHRFRRRYLIARKKGSAAES